MHASDLIVINVFRRGGKNSTKIPNLWKLNGIFFISRSTPCFARLFLFPFSSFFHYYRSLARALCPPLSLSLYFSPSLYSFAFIYFAPATNLLPPVSAFVPHSLYFSSSPTHSAQLSSNIHKLFESLPISLSCAKLTWEKFVPFIELFYLSLVFRTLPRVIQPK